ncbi:MAG: hypothetical protein WCJ30_21265 [Deltaproteobacteria bacterium]
MSASDVLRLATIDTRSCILRQNGTIGCWGFDFYNPGDISRIVEMPVTTPAISLAMGTHHLCWLTARGDVSCSGDNSNGQLGRGDTDPASGVVHASVADIRSITAGYASTCGVDGEDRAICWGSNQGGAVLPNALSANFNMPPSIEPVPDVRGVATLFDHSCAVRLDGSVWCWGDGTRGQMGDGHRTPSAPAHPVLGVHDAVGVTVAETHSCAWRSDGTVTCWGSNLAGQLGNGERAGSLVPVEVTGFDRGRTVASGAGFGYTCSIVELARATSVRCAGSNGHGQLGDGSFRDRPEAQPVVGLPDADTAQQITVGVDHTCVLYRGRSLYCWGRNDHGQLGAAPGVDAPSATVGPTFGVDVAEVSAGGSHTCVRLSDGTVQCWGSNADGQLGDGTQTDRWTPAPVPGISDAIALSTGGAHTCVVRTGGTVSCWGSNRAGQLGDGTVVSVTSPQTVSGLASVVEVSASRDVACTSAGASAWLDPCDATGVRGCTTARITRCDPTGADHTCARLADGSVWCWGRNDRGQLGDGTRESRRAPVRAALSHPAREVATGGRHTCARGTDDAVVCWGDDAWGESSFHGAAVNVTTPTAIEGLQ